MAARCFCPPESVTPRSPTMVSKPCGKLLELLANVGCLGGFEQGFGVRFRRAKGQVFADGRAEKKGLLGHHADIAPQHRQRIVAHRAAIDQQ